MSTMTVRNSSIDFSGLRNSSQACLMRLCSRSPWLSSLLQASAYFPDYIFSATKLCLCSFSRNKHTMISLENIITPFQMICYQRQHIWSNKLCALGCFVESHILHGSESLSMYFKACPRKIKSRAFGLHFCEISFSFA